jgi:hypothetical protein
MTTDAPERIYLQVDSESDEPLDWPAGFEDLEGVTWCQDRVYPADVEYLRRDGETVTALVEALEEVSKAAGKGKTAGPALPALGSTVDSVRNALAKFKGDG